MEHNYGIKLTQLRALVTIADFGSFSEAAWQLGLTQSTISHAISDLEDSLGVVLVSRTSRGSHLTPAGEAIVQRVRNVISLLGEIEQVANQFKGLKGGRIRIAAFRGAAANLLPKLIVQFQKNYSGVEIAVQEFYDYVSVEQQVSSGHADIGITCLPTRERFEVIQLIQDPYVVLLPSAYKEISNPLSLQQLLDFSIISYPEDNSCFQNLTQHFKEIGYSLKPRFQFRETNTILNMVAEGLGVAIMPLLSTNPLPKGVSIVNSPTPLERTVAAVLVRDALHPPTVYAFIQLLKIYSNQMTQTIRSL